MPKPPTTTELVPVTPTAETKREYARKNPDGPRVPPEVGGVQSNFCRNINCDNFGVPPLASLAKGLSDGYRLVSKGKGSGQRLKCMKCGQHSSLKSNAGIVEELARISAYLDPPLPLSCPNEECPNHGVSVDVVGHYQSKGYTSAGAQRWKCKACGTSASVRKRREQTMSHKNATIFRMLVNKGAIRATARVADVNPQTVYAKIDFIHEQCLAFMADRERRIAAMGLRRLYVSTDRQDHVLNWTSRKDRKNTVLTSIASVENRTGYVFGMHANFDPSVDTEVMEAQAIVAGDFGKDEPSSRKFARFWTTPDYEESKASDPAISKERPCDTGDVRHDILQGYKETKAIPDPEAKERTPSGTRLPSKGAQIHFEYTVHAHFRLLRRLLGDVGKIRFFTDQDDTIRAACISTYHDVMKDGLADVFFVKIDKGMNVDQRRELAAKSHARFDEYRKAVGKPDMKDFWVRVKLLEAEIQSMEYLSARDRWVAFPESTMAEPLKAVCWLTDRHGVQMDLRHLAIVFARASMHAVDRYFMQIRRLLMAMERPIHTPSNDGRVWRGYSPYNPAQVQKLLDIYRCYYNFVQKGGDGMTPAMRIGLAKGMIRIEDILYFK